jgi:hypothetical protein
VSQTSRSRVAVERALGKFDILLIRHALRLVEDDTAAVRPNLNFKLEFGFNFGL